MIKRIFFLLIFVSFIWTPVFADVFNPQSFHLPNGMQVVVIENHRAPVISHMVWYKIGAADEDPGKSGLAHFFEHLMFKGTDTVKAGEFSRIVKRLGGNDNAFTSQDYTAYYQNVPKKHLEKVMKMESDRMHNLNASDENILTERNVIIEERKQRIENNPAAILDEEVDNALFANHPYGIPVIGWMSEIKSLTPESVRAFYRKWYAPNNAILVLSGDITIKEVKPLAEKYYGAIEPTSVPERHLPEAAPIHAHHRISYADPRVGTPVVKYTYRAPAGNEALQVLANAFGGDTTSPLYKHLVFEQSKAVQAGAYYNAVSRGPSTLTVYAVPAPGVPVDVTEEALKSEIEDLLKNGLDTKDIDRAKNQLKDAAIFERDSLQGPAMIVGRALSSGFDMDYIENWPERVSEVSEKDIYKVRDIIFNGENQPIISTLLPEESDTTPSEQPEGAQ